MAMAIWNSALVVQYLPTVKLSLAASIKNIIKDVCTGTIWDNLIMPLPATPLSDIGTSAPSAARLVLLNDNGLVLRGHHHHHGDCKQKNLLLLEIIDDVIVLVEDKS